ncbi:hypothetical protein HPB48_011923 [Haemaphysalis longicornis]|uniref:Ig-like domain-containing protein n=1 Tax=Haemaphysalis longicornis TaxID=44386 RepID=A0A9J6FM62_HAELO|nr:hypothetical protein HPB48_011923 [Haemaphysalis longicornis]
MAPPILHTLPEHPARSTRTAAERDDTSRPLSSRSHQARDEGCSGGIRSIVASSLAIATVRRPSGLDREVCGGQVSCQQSPVISYISKEMVVGIGDTVDLQCSVQYADAYPIIWVKTSTTDPSNNLFISSGSKAVVPDQRFSIRHDEGSNTYTLQITKLQETDSGLYQCQIILGPTSKLSSNVYVTVRGDLCIYVLRRGGRWMWGHERSTYVGGADVRVLPTRTLLMPEVVICDTIHTLLISLAWFASHIQAAVLGILQFLVPPIISDNSTRSVIASTGQNITLECYATGHPTPHISWRRENNDLLPTGGAVYRGNILNIFNVSKNDRGTYYCIADNGVGNGARRNIGVEVEFAPVVSVDRPRYGQALQNPMDLLCHIEAFPSPSVVWLKDGYQLNDNQYYRISIFSTAEEFTDSTLRINAIEKKQYGNYSCKALNKLGSDEKIIELYETVNVICPPACDKSYQAAACHLQSLSASVLVLLSMLCALLAKH